MKIWNKWWDKKAGFAPEMCSQVNRVSQAYYELQYDFGSATKAVALNKELSKLLEFTVRP